MQGVHSYIIHCAVMLNKGYLAAGYEVLALDDCWQSSRNATTGKEFLGVNTQYRGPSVALLTTRMLHAGQIIPDPSKFPDGIEPVIAYVTSQCLPAAQGGNCLRFGLYSDAGTNTCAGRPGGWTYETIDAQTYASWNVSFLKYDNCNNLNIDPVTRYTAMSNALMDAYTAAGKHR
jgi:alpha-galactosidase